MCIKLPKIKTQKKKADVSILPTLTPTSAISLLSITNPENESVTDQKTIELKGKAPANASIIITTENGHIASVATDTGDFSEEIILDNGVNILQITAISDGKEESIIHTISYSTESF